MEWKQDTADMMAQIKQLTADNEELVNSNAQLTTALEEMARFLMPLAPSARADAAMARAAEIALRMRPTIRLAANAPGPSTKNDLARASHHLPHHSRC